jgi:putative Mg2+ transporter-C (MgtC) family protein
VDTLWGELNGASSDIHQLVRITVRVVAALIIGASIGIQRQLSGHVAGLRTHMLVSLGTTLFVLACLDLGHDALSRVIQGIATGVGFLGTGAILKLEQQREIFGLTTAAGVWLTAGASVCAATGHYVTALLAVVLAWCVLALLVRFEQRLAHPRHDHT